MLMPLMTEPDAAPRWCRDRERRRKENATDQHCRQDDEHKTRCGGRAGPGRGGAGVTGKVLPSGGWFKK